MSDDKDNIEQEKVNKLSWWKKLLGLNPTYKLPIKKKYLIILTIISFLVLNYTFFVKKITYLFESYYSDKNDFIHIENVIKTRIFLLNNSLGKKDNSYQTAVDNLLNFYVRQWCYHKAENLLKKYTIIPQDDFNQFHFYKDLSYILQKEKKYIEAKFFLEKANTLNENSNKFKYNLDEVFLLLFLDMNLQKELSDFFVNLETRKNIDKNYNYYNIFKNIKEKKYISAKKRIENELISSDRDLSLYRISVPTKYSNIIVQEIYRNSLRKLLIKILIEENKKEQAKKILSDVTYSEQEIYGYYSPENLCNTYYIHKLNEDNIELDKIQNIASKLVIFKNENKNNYYEKISVLCK